MIPSALNALLVPGTDDDIAAAYQSFAERARSAVFGFEDEVALLDIETTGFDCERDAVIEVAAAVMRGCDVVERYSTLVDPGCPIPPEITALTGIADGDVAGAPSLDEALASLATLVGERDIVAHNADFDRDFLTLRGRPATFSGEWLDTLELSRIALPRLRSHRLSDLAEAFGAGTPSHRAADDVEALSSVWRVLLVALADLAPAILRNLVGISPQVNWPLRGPLAHILRGTGGAHSDLRALRSGRTTKSSGAQLVDAFECELTRCDRDAVAKAFGPDGLAAAMYCDYEHRGEQREMADAVARALGDGRHLAVEAGTGVGKSLAYLVPAARFALDNGVGVGIATKTNALMDQLVYGELPALAEAMGEGLRRVALKGYEHYLCLRKLERAIAQQPEDRAVIGVLACLLSWVNQSSWGDLDSVNVHWPRRLKQDLACSVADCTRKKCRYYPGLCYLHGIRRRAASAHIVVTNHSLLFRDVVAEGGILPPIRHWIVDEAHGVESEAREQLSRTASGAEISAVLRALHAKGRGGLLDALARAEGGAAGAAGRVSGAAQTASEAVRTASTLCESFFAYAKDVGATRAFGGYDRARLRLTSALRDEGAWATTEGVGRSLARKLESVLAEGRGVVTALEEHGDRYEETRADLVGLLTRLADQATALGCVLDGSDSDFVYSLTSDRRAEVAAEELSAEMLDIGVVLAERFYPRLRSVVFASATLAAGNDFSHFERAVGLSRLPTGSWDTLRLLSSYDFERQMSVFVPTDMDEPGAAHYLAQMERFLAEIHLATGGAVLTLFTNRRDMEVLHGRIAPTLARRGVRVLLQGRGTSRKRLRDEFIADATVCLFATKTFWEGFDAKGDTLRCVIVPKLPFGPMNDPVLEERKERHRDWWESFYLPEAILELKQAAGRLIRSSTDRGCLVLADARLVSDRKYAREFLSALPVADVERLSAARVIEEVRERFGARHSAM